MSETTAPAEAPAAAPAATEAPAVVSNLLAEAVAPAPDAPAVDPAAPPVEPEAPAEPADPAPVEYKDLKVPEGINPEDPALSAFTTEAAKLGIDQAKAEALLATVAPQIAEQLAQPYKAWNELQTKWQSEVKADPEIGGDKFEAMKVTVARVMDNPALTDPAFRAALTATGAGNNPAIIRTLARWANQLTEGSHVAGAPAPQLKSVAERLYPNQGA